MRVMIVTPNLGGYVPRTVKFNAQTSYLCSFLRSKSIEVIVRDANWKQENTKHSLDEAINMRVDGLIIVCNNTLLYGTQFKQILDWCNLMRQERLIDTIWLTGYMATSFCEEIRSYAPNAAGISSAQGIRWIPPNMSNGIQLGELISLHAQFHDDHPGLTALDPTIRFQADDRLSLLSSRSCNARCSFCSYNNDQEVGWRPRPVSSVIDDLLYGLRTFGNRPITFSDNDFLGSRHVADKRVKELCLAMDALDDEIRFSINTRSDCFSLESLRDLASVGLTNVTVGLESLDPDTLANVYNKRLDYQHLHTLLDEAEKVGVSFLLSYILWQPFLTIKQLAFELKQLAEIGRWRIPQLLVNSVVKVVPGTRLENILEQKGLLHRKLFSREWDFVDKEVEKVYKDLLAWHKSLEDPFEVYEQTNNKNRLIVDLAKRKKDEFEFLLHRVCT